MLKCPLSMAVSILGGLLIVGCAAPIIVPKVADKPPLEIEARGEAKPIHFRKIVLKIGRGEKVGAEETGPFCLPTGELRFRRGRIMLTSRELTKVFRDELQAAGFELVNHPNLLFKDPMTWKAELFFAGMVKRMKANICFPWAVYGDYGQSKGEAFMEVEWWVYSRSNRQAVHKLTTRGYARHDSIESNGHLEIFLDAFAQAIRGMLADQGLGDLLTGTSADGTAADK